MVSLPRGYCKAELSQAWGWQESGSLIGKGAKRVFCGEGCQSTCRESGVPLPCLQASLWQEPGRNRPPPAPLLAASWQVSPAFKVTGRILALQLATEKGAGIVPECCSHRKVPSALSGVKLEGKAGTGCLSPSGTVAFGFCFALLPSAGTSSAGFWVAPAERDTLPRPGALRFGKQDPLRGSRPEAGASSPPSSFKVWLP